MSFFMFLCLTIFIIGLLFEKIGLFIDLSEGTFKESGRTKREFLISLIPYGYFAILLLEKYSELKD